MSITRQALRIQLAQEMRLGAAGDLSAATATTAVDGVSPDRKMEADNYWNGGNLLIVSGTGGGGVNLLVEGSGTLTQTNGGTVDQVSTTDPKKGTTCIKCVMSATAGSVAKWSYTATVVASADYELAFWSKGDATVCGRYGLYNVTGAVDYVAATPTDVTATEWTRTARRFTTPAACVSLRVDLWGSADLSHTVYFDDPVLRRLPQARYITTWVQSTGTWTVPTWTTNPAAGSQYHVFNKTFSVGEYDRAINKAINAAFPSIYALREDTSITTATNTYAYALPSSIDPKYVVKVELQISTSATTYPYQREIFYHIREANGTNYIQFDAQPASGYIIRVTYIAPHDGLLSDWDELEDRFASYVVAQGKAELYKTLLAKTTKADRAQVGENIAAFSEEAQHELRTCGMQLPLTFVKPQRYGH